MENKRIASIWAQPIYQQEYGALQEMEKDRAFCRHGLVHFLDVARIAYIFNLERQLGLTKDVIYAAALLHDIGRARQYQGGLSHDAESAVLARQLLEALPAELAFTADEENCIVEAVRHHRGDSQSVLGRLLHEADRLSRNCFACAARGTCYWPEDKKNKSITI